ncbi:MAG: putative glycoside hydrolase [Anaerolineales bacterium]
MMNKSIVRIMSALLALTLTLGSIIPGQAKSQPELVMSEGLVNLAHFYKPPSNTDSPTLASKFRFVLLTGGDEVFRDKVLSNGFGSIIPQYFTFLGIQDPGSCTASPRNNQVAYNAGDFCYISQNHPDWFLLDANGQRIRNSPNSDSYRMDPGNLGWREYFVRRVLERQNRSGWSGLFLDCLESSLADLQRYGTLPARYPDDASYRVAILGFLEYLRVNYSQPYGRPVLANITQGLDDATWSSYMQSLDGAMQERWAVDWDVNIYVNESKWEADLARAEKFQSQGKYLILVAPGNQADANRQNFAFASYLLISNGKAAFRYSNSDVYHEVWMYSNYQVDLGTPLGPRYKSGNRWKREFTHGVVTVDPVNHTATIEASWAWPYVKRLYNAGITSGCGGDNFCPEETVTRAQMAVFLERSMRGSSYTPPVAGGSTGFGDVPTTHWAGAWIKQLAADSITSGCGSGNYCPEAPVTRAQMAVFLLKAKHGSAYTPPAAGSSTGFSDVAPTHWAAVWIKQMAAEGITGGCGTGTYCPESVVTRAQMAVFLVRAFNLP